MHKLVYASVRRERSLFLFTVAQVLVGVRLYFVADYICKNGDRGTFLKVDYYKNDDMSKR